MIVIIDYGSGNLRSVAKAVEHVASGRRVTITSDAKTLAEASHIILPGVGAFGDCVAGLKALPDMIETLEEKACRGGTPFLGICVGMQMLFEEGHEHGVHAGLGWLKGKVVALTPDDPALKVPHMGWNALQARRSHALLNGVNNEVYFVHSYHALCRDAEDVITTTEYGGDVVAAVARGNVMGVQFHPEKSQQAGLMILKNFLSLA